jgi:hypothetical protein
MKSSSLLRTLGLSILCNVLASWTSTTSRVRSAGYRPRRCRHTHKRIITSRAALCCPSILRSCCVRPHTRERERRRRFRPSATSKPSGRPVVVRNPHPRLGLATCLCQQPLDGHRHGHLPIVSSPLSPPSPRTPQHYRAPLLFLRSRLLCRLAHLGSVRCFQRLTFSAGCSLLVFSALQPISQIHLRHLSEPS